MIAQSGIVLQIHLHKTKERCKIKKWGDVVIFVFDISYPGWGVYRTLGALLLFHVAFFPATSAKGGDSPTIIKILPTMSTTVFYLGDLYL